MSRGWGRKRRLRPWCGTFSLVAFPEQRLLAFAHLVPDDRVDDGARAFAPQDLDDLGRGGEGEFAAGLGGQPGGVRRQDEIVERVERVVGAGRLDREDIERRAANPALAQRLGQGVGLDERAAGRVDQDRLGAHPPQLRRADHPARLGGQFGVAGDDRAGGEQIIEFVHEFDPERGRFRRGDVGIVGDDVHRKRRLTLARHLAPDAAEADDPQRAPLQLDPPRLMPIFPANPGADALVVARHLLGEIEDEGEGMLRDRDAPEAGIVDDGDPLLGRLFDVDRVGAAPGGADHQQIARLADHFLVEACGITDERGVGGAERPCQFRVGRTADRLDIGVFGQQRLAIRVIERLDQ